MNQVLVARERDADLIPSNVKAGVTIDDTTGNYSGWIWWGSVEMWPSNNFWHAITAYSVYTNVPGIATISAWANPWTPGPTTSTTKHVIAYAWTYSLHTSRAFYTPSTIDGYVDILLNGVVRQHVLASSYQSDSYDTITVAPWDEITVAACWISGHASSYISISLDIWAWFRVYPQPDMTWFATTEPV